MTYYEILEVSESASQEVITMAYRTLAVKYHPDRCKGDPEIAKTHWKRINAAYLVLSVPEERRQYDEFLRLKRSQSQATPSETTAENSEPKEPGQKPEKQKIEKTFPSFKRSAITVAILLPLAFVLLLLLYVFIKEYSFAYAIFLSFGDIVLFTFSYMFFPLFIGAFKKNCSLKFIETMSWINSAVIMVFWNVINESSVGEGWMTALIFAIITKHAVIQMRQKIQRSDHRPLVAGVLILVLAITCVCWLFGHFVILDVTENAYYLENNSKINANLYAEDDGEVDFYVDEYGIVTPNY